MRIYWTCLRNECRFIRTAPLNCCIASLICCCCRLVGSSPDISAMNRIWPFRRSHASLPLSLANSQRSHHVNRCTVSFAVYSRYHCPDASSDTVEWWWNVSGSWYANVYCPGNVRIPTRPRCHGWPQIPIDDDHQPPSMVDICGDPLSYYYSDNVTARWNDLETAFSGNKRISCRIPSRRLTAVDPPQE